MRYLIIGLGIYGTNLALDLTEMGHEVIGADVTHEKVDAIKDYISNCYIVDSTDEQALLALPLKNVDEVIVAIGENFGASIKTVALLKKAGVENIYARAIDELHESILQGLKVKRILTPEQRAASDLAHEMEIGTHVDILRIDKNYLVLKFPAPSYFYGFKYASLQPERLFGLRLVAATRKVKKKNVLGIEHSVSEMLDLSGADPTLEVQEGDVFTCIGSQKSYNKLYAHINS